MKQRATVVCREGTRILLVGKSNARWSLPGGKPEAGEALDDAAARELFEETRLRATGMQYLFAFAGTRTCHHVFVAQLEEGESPVPSNEITRCTWARVTDIGTLDTSVSTRGIVDVLAIGRNRGVDERSRHQRADAFVQNLRLALHNAQFGTFARVTW